MLYVDHWLKLRHVVVLSDHLDEFITGNEGQDDACNGQHHIPGEGFDHGEHPWFKVGAVITREVNFGTGESAITHYERLAAGKEYSLAELHLETGRTHQIRVHMKYIGHPLPGDYLYNPDYRRINRQPLHSYQLEFTHPTTGKVMLFTAPLPIDFISAFYSNSLK